MYSMVLSIFYLLTCCATFFGIFVVKKSEKELNFILCIPVYAIVALLYTAFFAGIIFILHIPVNLISLGIGNILLSTGLCVYSFVKKQFQKYKFSWFDLAALLLFVILAVFVAISQFGSNLYINYETTDPSRHMRMAADVIYKQEIEGMYFGALYNAVFTMVGLGFVKSFWAYKLFILADISMFVLSGFVMYCATRLYAKKPIQRVMAVLFTGYYMLCYPLNNMVFGFVHLGIGVLICSYLVVMAHCYADSVNKVVSIVSLMLGAYGIIICYSLFAPFTYVAIALFIAIEFIKEKRLFSKEFFATEFGVFLIPTVMGSYFSFFKSFGGEVSAVGTSIGMEGYIYRDLYSNFIIILPFVIYGLINAFVTKKVRCQHIFLLVLGVAVLVMFWFGMQGKVSSYYYYKMYYLLSMVCFIVAVEGVCELCKKSITVIISYVLVWLFMALMNFGKIDDKITEHKVLMSPSSWSSGAFFPIIEFNFSCMQEGNFTIERLQLFEESHNKQVDGNKVTLLSTTEPIYWFEAMVQCTLEEFYCYDFNACDIDAYMKHVEETCDYVLVYTEHDTRFDEYISDWEVAYQNADGTLYSVK